MDKCSRNGGAALCFADSLLFSLDVCVFCVTVSGKKANLLRIRLAFWPKWRTAKSVAFCAIALGNLMFATEVWFKGDVASVLHLFHDYAKFMLFTTVFYYFSLHAFQILGNSRMAQVIVWVLALINVFYLSGFSVYVAYDLVTRHTESYCKSQSHLGLIWLMMCVGICVISLALFAVGLFAVKFLRQTHNVKNKKREVKLWVVIWVLLVASFLELAYDAYQLAYRPNRLCVGLLPVLSNQSDESVGNSLTWMFHKLITSSFVDFAVMYAFWPTKKRPSPLLKDAEEDERDENALRLITRHPVSKTVSSDSSLSFIEEDKSPQTSNKSTRTKNRT